MRTRFIDHFGGAWIFVTLLMVLLCGGVFAQDPPQPSWRQGVSRWTGAGYGLSGESVSSPVPVLPPLPLPAPLRSDVPYVLPVDPGGFPTWRGSDATLTLAPMIALPARNVESPLELTSPADDTTPPPIGESVLPSPASEALVVESSMAESIAAQLDQDEVVETVPLDEEATRWYQYPRRWMRGWDSHAELGLDGSTGNARTVALQTGLEMKRETERQILALDIDYRQASNRSVTTEDNGRLNLDYDRMLMDTPWSGFAKFGMEWDKFKAFDLRLNVNSGLGYHWIRRDDASLVTRFGAGASKEIGAPDDDWIPEAVFGAAAERQLTSRQKLKGKIDYFPAWEDFSNFRLVSDLAWEILLDGSDNLSLKLAATDRYDSTPQGAKKNDLYYSLLLLYKF